ncbi:MAG: actin family protein [Candidatus Hodarchaeota archaeon]
MRAPIILDFGSHTCKAGFAGNDQPSLSFRTVLGTSMEAFLYPSLAGYPETGSLLDNQTLEWLIGFDAVDTRQPMKYVYPIHRGRVIEWDAFEKLLIYVFETLQIDPAEQPFLFLDRVLAPKTDREKLAELCFENFDIPGIYVLPAGRAALNAAGTNTGIVIEIGHGVLSILPVYETFPLYHAAKRLDIGGKDITEYLIRLARTEGIPTTDLMHPEVMEKVKEKLCYVAPDITHTPSQASCDYVTQTGEKKSVEMMFERTKAPEILFNPQLVGKEILSLQKAILESVTTCDVEIRGRLYSNIVLSGGSALFKGLETRLTQELLNLAPHIEMFLKIQIIPKLEHLAWTGAGIATIFQREDTDIWITRDEYFRTGAMAIHRSG